MSEPSDKQDRGHDSEHSCRASPSALLVELREHVPFSVAAVSIGLIVAGTICILGFTAGIGRQEAHDHAAAEPAAHEVALEEHAGHEHGEDDHGHETAPAVLFFHLFHSSHMLFSAAATAAMFCRYERRWLKAVAVGLVGAIGVCGVSDIVFPHLSLMLLGAWVPWHICVVEHPGLVLPFAVVGVLVGVGVAGGVHRSTIISHTLHVFVSTMASIFYMVSALGLIEWIHQLGQVFVFVVIAVMIPCCVSDIVFPMLMSRPGRERYEQEPHVH